MNKWISGVSRSVFDDLNYHNQSQNWAKTLSNHSALLSSLEIKHKNVQQFDSKLINAYFWVVNRSSTWWPLYYGHIFIGVSCRFKYIVAVLDIGFISRVSVIRRMWWKNCDNVLLFLVWKELVPAIPTHMDLLLGCKIQIYCTRYA